MALAALLKGFIEFRRKKRYSSIGAVQVRQVRRCHKCLLRTAGRYPEKYSWTLP